MALCLAAVKPSIYVQYQNLLVKMIQRVKEKWSNAINISKHIVILHLYILVQNFSRRLRKHCKLLLARKIVKKMPGKINEEVVQVHWFYECREKKTTENVLLKGFFVGRPFWLYIFDKLPTLVIIKSCCRFLPNVQFAFGSGRANGYKVSKEVSKFFSRIFFSCLLVAAKMLEWRVLTQYFGFCFLFIW